MTVKIINKLLELFKIAFLRAFRVPIGWILNIEKIPDPVSPSLSKEENIFPIFPEDKEKRQRISEVNPRMLFSRPTDWGVEILDMIETGKMLVGDPVSIPVKSYVEYHMMRDPTAKPQKFKNGILKRDISHWPHLKRYSFSENKGFDNAGTEYFVIKRLT